MSARGVLIAAVLVAACVAGAGRAAAQDMAVHLGSFKTEAEARGAWARVKAQNAGALGGVEARILETDVPGRGVWVRVLVPVASRADANRLCQTLKASNQYCVPMAGALGAGRPTEASAPPPASAPAPVRAAPPPPAPVAAAPAPPPPPVAAIAPPPIAQPTEPLRPAEPNAAASYFGVWARGAEDCARRSMTIGPARIAIRDDQGLSEMACKVDLKGKQLSLVCEDGSRALFEVADTKEMLLRWTQSTPQSAPLTVDLLWKRCADGARRR